MNKYLLLFCFTAISFLQAQNIKVYYNQSVDNSISPMTDAKSSSHLDDTISALINSSVNTLDIAVWDNGSSKIVTAINNAYSRGVQVRYISSTNSINAALSGLNANITILKRNSGLTNNVMHNKFVIVDNSIILTGSMNFGAGSMFDDYNNVVLISDTVLSQNYTAEFNEMWGSAVALPNTSNSKFGLDKTDNTSHSFVIGGISVQSYFSPTDHTTNQIISAINSADYTLDIALFTFINNDIGDAVVAAKNRGVDVRCIIENVSYFGSEYNKLMNAQINVVSHETVANDFHHKYCIIDAVNAGSDPIVVTGSHNWTNSAEDDYDENTLIIHDLTIANQYLEEFTKRFTELGNVSIYETTNSKRFTVYQSVVNGIAFIQLSGDIQNCLVEVYNTAGQVLKTEKIHSPIQRIDLSHLNNGFYLIKLTTGNRTIGTVKFTVVN